MSQECGHRNIVLRVHSQSFSYPFYKSFNIFNIQYPFQQKNTVIYPINTIRSCLPSGKWKNYLHPRILRAPDRQRPNEVLQKRYLPLCQHHIQLHQHHQHHISMEIHRFHQHQPLINLLRHNFGVPHHFGHRKKRNQTNHQY